VVQVKPRLVDATGTVINTFSNETVTGALVTLESGPEAGRATRAAFNGVFQFTGLSSLNVVVRAEADGFERELDNLSALIPTSPRKDPDSIGMDWGELGNSPRRHRPVNRML
jgi:hypothetical protein